MVPYPNIAMLQYEKLETVYVNMFTVLSVLFGCEDKPEYAALDDGCLSRHNLSVHWQASLKEPTLLFSLPVNFPVQVTSRIFRRYHPT